MLRRVLISTLTAAALLLMDTQSAVPGYGGVAACRACHPKQSQSQAQSAHAAALFRTPRHSLAAGFPLQHKLLRTPACRFEFFRVNGRFGARMSDPTALMELPMEWAFGAGRQAVTFASMRRTLQRREPGVRLRRRIPLSQGRWPEPLVFAIKLMIPKPA
ncbi:MAG: hypothetical protein QOJ99_6173 [Bryobacterales bacterium]|nr:hypothetical protein [Bryobacterales bacterium]